MAYSPAITAYYKRERDFDYDILNNVTSTKEGWRRIPSGLYRDGGGVGEATLVLSGTGNNTATVPVVAIDGTSVAPNAATSAKGTVPDEAAHVPPRQRYELVNGLYIAINSAVIPEMPGPITAVHNFTAAVTDVCTAVGHTLVDRDLVSVSTSSALPAGLSATSRYLIQKLSADTFRLLTEDSVPVNITDTGTGTHTVALITPSIDRYPSHLPEGVFFVEGPYNFSTVDPR